MIYFITYILFSVIISLLSLNKRIGFVESLLISLFLTPIVGLAIVLKTKNNILTSHYSMKHTCNTCGDVISQKEKECPSCGTNVEFSYNTNELTFA